LGAKLRIYADRIQFPVLPGSELPARRELLVLVNRRARMDGIDVEAFLNRVVSDAEALRQPHIHAFMPGKLNALKARLRRARKR
jgi:hypothetical protein